MDAFSTMLATQRMGRAAPQARGYSRFPSYDKVVAVLKEAGDRAPDRYTSFAGIGSRETPAATMAGMTAIAKVLDGAGFYLRSGGADGADTAFEAGMSRHHCEIFIPWKGFNGSNSPYYPRPEHRHLVQTAQAIAEKAHPAWHRCSDGAKKLHTRNVHQVLGEALDNPVAFVIAWTKDGAATGGTGQAIRIAWEKQIPVINLKIAEHRQAIIDVLKIDPRIFESSTLADAANPLARIRG